MHASLHASLNKRQKRLNNPHYSHKKSYCRLTATSCCSWQPGVVDVLLIIQNYKSASADFRGKQIARSGPIMQKKKKTQKTVVCLYKTITNVVNISDKQSWLEVSMLYSSSLLTYNNNMRSLQH